MVCCVDVLTQLTQGVRTLFRSGRTLPAEWRIQQLNAMLQMLDEQSDAITAALQQDLNKVHSFTACCWCYFLATLVMCRLVSAYLADLLLLSTFC